MADAKEPCGNEDCDICHPLPRFKISTERVQRVFYERTIKAATLDDAVAEYDAGTAWPSSYDDRYAEVLEKRETVVTLLPPAPDPSNCYHVILSKENVAAFLERGKDDYAEQVAAGAVGLDARVAGEGDEGGRGEGDARVDPDA